MNAQSCFWGRKDTIFLLFLPALATFSFSYFSSTSAQAQNGGSIQKIDFLSGVSVKGKRKRNTRPTVSNVVLPDLNAILSPIPSSGQGTGSSQTKVRQARVVQSYTGSSTPSSQPTNGTGQPRFGFGSPDGEPAPTPGPQVDPRLPIDPGYDPAPSVPDSDQARNKGSAALSVPQVSISHTWDFPLFYGYSPRTYHYGTPYAPYPVVRYHGSGYRYSPLFYGNRYSYGFGGYGSRYGYGLYSSRAPLRGLFTSSRNYLSGFCSPVFRFRF